MVWIVNTDAVQVCALLSSFGLLLFQIFIHNIYVTCKWLSKVFMITNVNDKKKLNLDKM